MDSEEQTFHSIIVRPDGKILVAGGYSFKIPGDLQPINPIVLLNADGIQGPSFDAGISPIAIPDPFENEGEANFYNTAILQTDGKILIAGGTVNSSSQQIFRLNTGGSVDNSFITQNLGIPRALALQSDGKVLVGGAFQTINRMNITRLNTDGSPDNTFNSGIGFDGQVRVIIIQNDQKILY